MARLPSSIDLSSPSTLRTGRMYASADNTVAGRGLASFGQDVADIGVERVREQIGLDGTASQGGATRELNEVIRSFQSDTDYGNYSKKFEKAATAIVEKYAPVIRDAKARRAWAENFKATAINDARERILNAAQKGERDIRVSLGKQGLQGFQSVIADPDSSDAARDQAKRDADEFINSMRDSGDLDPAEADSWRNAVIKGGEFVLGERELQRNPGILTGKLPAAVSDRAAAAMSFFQGKGWTKEQAAGIVGNLIAESKLQPSGAVGDSGTAFGVAQWRGARLTKLKRFAAANGADWQDFNTQLQFVDIELREDETSAYSALKSARTVEEAAAAFVGFERPRGWTAANPAGAHNFKGRVTFAKQAAGETIKPDWYTSQSPEDQYRLEQLAESQQRQENSDAAAAAVASRGQARDDFNLRIANEDPKLTRQEILTDPRLDNGDRATLLTSLDAKTKEVREIAAAVQSFGAGVMRVDPYSSEGKKAVAGVEKFILEKTPPEQQLGLIAELTRQSGAVPPRSLNGIRVGLESTNTQAVVTAAETAMQLYAIDPAALARGDGGAGVRDQALTYDHFRRVVGLTQEEAALRLIDARDPEKIKAREALLDSKTTKEWIAQKSNEAVVRNIFDPGVFGSDPKLGEDDRQAAAMTAEYAGILRESLFDANGNRKEAQDLAATRFGLRYGPSALTLAGPSVVTRLPPEKTYKPGADGGWTYIRDQAVETLKGVGIAADEVFLESDDATEDDFQKGVPARYRLFYRDGDGDLKLYNFPFYASEPLAADVRAEQLKAAEKIMLENRQWLEMGQDREGTLNRFLDGNPLTGGM